MRKQCLVFMLLLAASERTEKNPLKIKFRKDIVESYKPIVWAEPRPISMLQNVICRITTYFYLTCSFAVWVCTLELRQPQMKQLYIQLIQKRLSLYEYPSVHAQNTQWYGRVGLTTTFSKIAVHTKQHRIHIPMQTRTQQLHARIAGLFFTQFGLSCFRVWDIWF